MANKSANDTAIGDALTSPPVPKLPIKDTMTDEQFHSIMEKGYQQAMAGQTLGVEDAFTQICEGI